MKEVGQAEKRFDEYLERLFWVADVGALEPSRDTNKMLQAEGSTPSVSPQSVTENTTRSLEPAPSEHAANQ
jgi:hypothetical protein